tara:strand:+ start:263 stop:574 length:312 start_codon:yes stop_codon:yes gene_type:complete
VGEAMSTDSAVEHEHRWSIYSALEQERSAQSLEARARGQYHCIPPTEATFLKYFEATLMRGSLLAVASGPSAIPFSFGREDGLNNNAFIGIDSSSRRYIVGII